MANAMYKYIVSKCKNIVAMVQTGSFGADMKVELLNDGHFLLMETNSFSNPYSSNLIRFPEKVGAYMILLPALI